MFPCEICKDKFFAKEHGLRAHWGLRHNNLAEAKRQHALQYARQYHRHHSRPKRQGKRRQPLVRRGD